MNDIYKYTILEYDGENRSTCGYCKGKNSNITYGMSAHNLHCLDYQNLIDRGWRRSGCFLYKPKMEDICCPLYTIRCEALQFNISKSQKKTLKKVNKFLLNHPKEEINDPQTSQEEIEKKETKVVRSGVGPDPNKPQCKKAKLIRLEHKLHKQGIDKTTQMETTSSSNEEEKLSNKFKKRPAQESFQSIEDISSSSTSNPELNPASHTIGSTQLESKILNFKDISNEGIHKLTFKLIRCNQKSKEFTSSLNESFEVYKKYQHIVHNDPLDKIKYERYLRFLVKNPLEATRLKYPCADDHGSFHMQYLLDGKIIAVGVLDILPLCVSSVYFYYNPDYNFLNLGCLSALLEIQLVQQLNKKYPNIKYYYMGYYIHSCQKMRYKGNYKPSYLLCPITYTWVSFELASTKIDANKFSRLSEENIIDENGEISRQNIRILKSRKLLQLTEYIQLHGENLLFEIFQWAKFVGKLILPNSILVL